MLENQIIALRNGAGMSQAQLAKELKISASAVGMYEQGRRIPNIDMLVAISKLFDVSLDYLITGTEHKQFSQKKAMLTESCPCNTCYWKDYREI